MLLTQSPLNSWSLSESGSFTRWHLSRLFCKRPCWPSRPAAFPLPTPRSPDPVPEKSRGPSACRPRACLRPQGKPACLWGT